MPKLSKSEKRARREAEERASWAKVPMLPEGYYFDDDGMLRMPDGRPIADGFYRRPEGGTLLYEHYFNTYGFPCDGGVSRGAVEIKSEQ